MKLTKMADKIRNATTYTEIKTISKHWQESTKTKVFEHLTPEEQERVWMLKNFANHPICTQFPLGCQVIKLDWDEGVTATVKGWLEAGDPIYIRLFVEWEDDPDGINSQWDFSQPEKLEIIHQSKVA